MISSFEESVRFLESFIPPPEKKHPGKLGLERMKYLVNLLGNPQLKYPTIHVGGTSGKGSTATIVVSILAAKYKVGLHTSPHLGRINERVGIFSRRPLAISARGLLIKKDLISDDEFVALLNKIIPSIKKLESSEYGKPSYFEIVAAMAFLYFAKKKVDIAVIEVGMGGRFDATNVIRPLVAVLTNVGLDHTEVLGKTVEEVAKDKVGIIKPRIQVVSGVSQPGVVQIVEESCRKNKAPLSLLERDFYFIIKKITEKESRFDYIVKGSDLKGAKGLTLSNLRLSLLGEHQVANASLAIRAIELFKKGSDLKGAKGLTLSIIRKALLSVFMPGRLEIIKKQPLVILDGAHNPDKAKALAKAIRKIFPEKRVITVIAIKNDKDARAILSELLPISSKVIFTRFHLTSDLGVVSSFEPTELMAVVKEIDREKKIGIINEAKKAVSEAIRSAEGEDLILVTGSLYLIGEVRKNFQFSNSKYEKNTKFFYADSR